jgi:hypothetical protein
MSLLGYHLNQKLFKMPEEDLVLVDEDFAQLIDANFPVMRGYHPKTKAADKLHSKWQNEKFNKIIDQIKQAKNPGFTDVILFLYDLAGSGADDLINFMEKTKMKMRKNGQHHDFSMIFENGNIGISFVCQSKSPETLSKNLLNLAIARKYKTKANMWIGIGSIANSPNIVDLVIFNNEPWEPDEELESFSKTFLKKGVMLGRNARKIGRNESCPCGSGKNIRSVVDHDYKE